MKNPHHYAIIMAGGIGSRFWPLSRTANPKQFQDILGNGKTLIQETFDRFARFMPAENIYIVTNSRYYNLVRKQLDQISDDQILLEPVGRNTAPCVAYATYKVTQKDPDAVFVVAPSDHLINDEDRFVELILLGLDASQKENIIMTLGITPTRPDTGYGYIQFLEDEDKKGYHKVKTFTEKPNLEVARSFLASGDFVWNAGIFLFNAQTIRQAFEQYLPEMADQFDSIQKAYYSPEEHDAIGRTYATCKNISIDYGIMEKATNVYVIPSEFGWSDLGTWTSVHQNSDKDYLENAVHGRAIIYESLNNVVRTTSPEKLVVLEGLEGYIVVDTEDVLLICRKDKEQFVKEIVGEVKEKYNDRYV